MASALFCGYRFFESALDASALGRNHFVAGELTDQAQVEAMLDSALKKTGQVGIVQNNAAIMMRWRDHPAQDFRKSFEVIAINLARICYRFVPALLDDGVSGRCFQARDSGGGISKRP